MVRIGCSGWNYDSWRGVLYPEGMGPARWLGEYATHLVDGGVDLPDVLEDEAGDHCIEGGVGNRQLSGAGPGEDGSPTPLRRDRQLVPRRVEPDDPGGTAGDGQTGHLTLAGPDVEHPVTAGEVLSGHGQDLLAVLGVSALGEALLPPLAVGRAGAGG